MRFSFLFLVLIATQALAQEVANADSLLRVIQKSKDDTLQVERFILMGQQLESVKPDSALRWYEKALNLSRKLGHTRGILRYYTNATYVYNMLGRADTSLLLNLRSVQIAREFGDEERLSACLGNVGSSYLSLEEHQKAIDYFLQSKEIAEKRKDIQKLNVIYSNLANVYRTLKQYEQAIEFANKGLALAHETANPFHISAALVTTATIKSAQGKMNEALPLLHEALAIARRVNDHFTELSALLNLGDANMKLGNYAQLEGIFRESLKLAETIGDPEGVTISNRGLGYHYLHVRDLKNAEKFATLSLAQATEKEYLHHSAMALTLLSDIALLQGQDRLAAQLLQKSDSVQEKIHNEEKLKDINRLEVQFKTREKENALIREQQRSELKSLAIRKNQLWISILSLMIIAIALIAWLMTNAANQRKRVIEKENELNHAKIIQLESEKRLLASQAVIKGQEEERGRLAKDLHDGLGGMLSGIKFSLANMKSNVVLDADSALQFERSLDMLDQSISELRRVAHNMMPEVLVKFGLDEALRSYCDALNQANIFKLSYQLVGTPKRFNSNTEIIAYRIVQELLNNVAKHAKASQVLVQLAMTDDELSLTVEDNGIGFDTNVINEVRGAGWANIRSRVNFLNGKLDIQSTVGTGTSVHITLPKS